MTKENMATRKILMLVMLLGAAVVAQGQRLRVDKFELKGNDLSAQYEKRLDGNKQLCALVKVATLAQKPEFDGNIVGKIEKRKGYYWVYMTADYPKSKDLMISSENYLPISVNFADYGIASLAAGVTYILELSAAQQTPQPVAAERTVERSRPVTSTALTPRWSSSVTASQRTVLEKLIANMVWVEGGSFMMGDDNGEDDEKPAHEVTLSDYYIGKYEVTQAEWEAVMGEKPTADGAKWTSEYGLGSNYPAYNISWNDCDAFIRKLNELTGMKFKLPTEAQWEYAARGGKSSRGDRYSGTTDNLGAVAWYWDNSGKQGIYTHPVGGKQANELGLYDMIGNVCEWCSDRYGISYYSSSPQTDPTGPSSGSYRVLRGGSWGSSATYCRVANRLHNSVSIRSNYDGMRLAL